ncbi:alpha/beta fold hydrolase [Salinicola sp. DM10]|uniref:alpha/beta fold hydrolase n=1 Tax=Salinicola sp. DM10 TaxID=2815721 RepID=UPI001A8C0A26|nr:alpha/beta fold hydrolase [Salinicola sp. DM10]MCE3025785.1 alpha/beta fold hydrolase [Salinicola sp. DM10]
MQLHCIDTGTVDADDPTRPLVVLHGLFGSADNWRSHIKQWQQTRRVVALDLRNHGRSPHAPGMRYAQMAADVAESLDALEIAQFDLLGHSMGGKVAITLARQRPRAVASLIVADIAPVPYEHGHDEIFAAMRRVVEGRPESRREADALMAESVDVAATRQFLATNLVRDDEGILRWRVGLDEIADGYENIIAAPDGEGAYPGPVLLLRGGNSPYVRDAYREAVAAVMPEATWETLEGAGHWLHAEQPEAFQQALSRFFAAI